MIIAEIISGMFIKPDKSPYQGQYTKLDKIYDKKCYVGNQERTQQCSTWKLFITSANVLP